jgi:hypothetical protein
MTPIGSSAATLIAGLHQAARVPGVAPIRRDDRVGAGGDAATLFSSSALSRRAAALNALMDDAGRSAQSQRQVRRITQLIDAARTTADQALHAASTVAKVGGTVPGLTGAVDIALDHGDTITVSDGHATATYIHAGGNKVADFLASVNDANGLNVEASLDADGWLRLEATGVSSITVGGSADAEELASIGLAAGTTSGSVNERRQDLARAFDAIRAEIDAVQLESNGSFVTAESLGIRRTASGDGGNFQSTGEITAALADLERAEATLKEKFPASQSSGDANVTRPVLELLTGDANDLAHADTGEDDANALAQQLREQVRQLRTQSFAGHPGAQVLRLFP